MPPLVFWRTRPKRSAGGARCLGVIAEGRLYNSSVCVCVCKLSSALIRLCGTPVYTGITQVFAKMPFFSLMAD